MTGEEPERALARTLLALLGPASGRPLDDELRQVDADGWKCMQRMVARHRLGPVLRWRLRDAPQTSVPTEFLSILDQRFREATLTALTRQRDLVLVFRVLEAAGIEAIALKGARLAFDVYPEPALRPMRDLDVLVPGHQALAAFEALLASGMRRDPTHPGDPHAHMAAHKHLPRLVAPGGSPVEVHHRLVDWRNPLAPRRDRRGRENLDLAQVEGYWERAVSRDVGGTSIRFPGATDLSLHLCVHAAYDDRFSGGALVLFDLDFLLGRTTPDWTRFWRDAERGGWTRGCALLLRLQQAVFATPGISWPEPDPSAGLAPDFVDRVKPLLLADIRLGRAGRLALETGGSRLEKLGLALGQLFARPTHVATLFNVPADSRRILLYYPAYWWRLVARRLPGYLQARANATVLADQRERTRVESWVTSDTPPERTP